MQALACLWTCSTNTHCYSHEILDTTWPILENTRPIVIVTHMKLTGVHNSDKPAREHKAGHSIPMDENLVLAILCLQMTMFFYFEYAPPLAFLQCRGVQNPSTLERGSAEYWEGGIGHGTFPKQENFGTFKSKSLRCIFSTQYENKFCNKGSCTYYVITFGGPERHPPPM